MASSSLAAETALKPQVTGFFEPESSTFSYVAACPETGRCAILDSVLDFELAAGRTRTDSADAIVEYVGEQGLSVDWILETHAHADHISAAPYLQRRLGGRIGIGARIAEVQRVFARLFNAEPDFAREGAQFDRLIGEGDRLAIGRLCLTAMATPGHTPACMTYLVGDAAFVGDTLFAPDAGTARCDFPGGDAATLYRSIQKILALPAETRLFLCHDYAPGGRAVQSETTVGEERRANIHVGAGTDADSFVEMRRQRDASLAMPRLILPSIQFNMRAGRFPPPEDNGISYLKLPLNAL